MEAIGCLVRELWSETQLSRKHNVMANVMSPYTIVLRKTDLCSCKRQLESQQRQLEKTAVVKAGAYIVSIDRKTTV